MSSSSSSYSENERSLNFDDFAGHPALVSYLKKVFSSDTASHAYLFYGPEDAGKRTLALICARALFCMGSQKPCGVCGPCRRFLTSNHPDVTILRPQPLSIGANDIRGLIDSLSVRAFEGGYKSVIIESADTMTQTAANALLKTLESPPDGTVFFLLTDKTVLPTIASRCQPVRFGRISEPDVEKALLFHGIPEDKAKALSQKSDGLVGKGLRLFKEGSQVRENIINALNQVKTAADIAEGSKRLLAYETNQVLDIIEEWLSSSLALYLQPRVPDWNNPLVIRSHNVYVALQEARKKLKSHVAAQLVFETVLFALSNN